MGQEVIWVGIDVGRYFHAWCAMDQDGQVVWKRDRVSNTTAAMSKALEQLQRVAAGRPLRFGSEEPGGNAAALIRLLTAAGMQILLTQPLRVNRFHLALGQPHKSDPYDAEVIADFMRQNGGRLAQVRVGTTETEALRVLSRRLDQVGKDFRRCLNRLRATLAEYAPEWLVNKLFSDWSGETALHTLERYGRISKLARTPLGRLSRALSHWSRGHFGADKARQLQQAFAQVTLPEALEAAYADTVSSLVAQIRSLQTERGRLEAQLASFATAVPALGAVEAELGYGWETAAIIASEVRQIADFDREPCFATYCGVTPLKRRSGISQGSSHLSRFTNKRLLKAVCQAAMSALRSDPCSQAYYQKKLAGREDPRSKTMALLALARHRTRRLYKVLCQSAARSEGEAHQPSPQFGVAA